MFQTQRLFAITLTKSATCCAVFLLKSELKGNKLFLSNVLWTTRPGFRIYINSELFLKSKMCTELERFYQLAVTEGLRLCFSLKVKLKVYIPFNSPGLTGSSP